MRNLKKVLSMTLALVMMLGMMTFAGAAEATKAITSADLTDMKDVVNKEQVSLLVDLGVINGIKQADGTYKYAPAEGINRASFAKMIFTVMMNKGNPDVYKGVTTGLSDVKGHWAEGYIAYCVSTKIASGDNNKKFNPDMPIQTVTAAKMLLTALGYNSKLSKYENDSLWAINVMKDAQAAGLLEGINLGADENLTRDAAAQMIFNALFADQKLAVTEHDMGIEYLKNYTNRYLTNNLLGETVFKLVAVKGTLVENEANGVANKGESILATLNAAGTVSTPTTYKVASKLEDLGKTVVFYKKGDTSTIYSTNVALEGKNRVVAVPTNLDSTSPDGDHKDTAVWLSQNGLTLSVDQVVYKYTNYHRDATVALTAAELDNLASAVLIDTNGDGVVDALIKSTKVIDFVTGDVKTATSGDTKTVYVPGVLSGYIDVKYVLGFDGLKKDDVVFTQTIANSPTATTFIEKAASFTGKITGSNTTAGKVFVDGKAYEISGIADAKFDSVAEYVALGYDKAVTFYTDAEGQIAFAKAEATTAVSKLAVVIGFEAASNTGVSDNAGVAKLLFMDGTTETVKLDVASYAPTVLITTAVGGAVTTAKTFDVVTYTVDSDGLYTLKDAMADGYTGKNNATSSEAVSYLTSKGISPNKPGSVMGTTDSDSSAIANAETVFVTVNANDAGTKITGYTVVTGIAKAPSYTAGGTGANGYLIAKGGVAKLVYIVSGTAQLEGTGDYLYTNTRNDANYDAAAKTYTIEAFVNGVKDQVVIAKSVYETVMTTNGLYKITVDNKVVVGASAAGAPISTGDGVSYDGGVIGANTTDVTPANRGYYTYNENTVVYVIDSTSGKAVVTAIAPDAIVSDTNDTVQLWGNTSTKVADVVIITKVANPVVGTTSFNTAITSVKTGAGANTAAAELAATNVVTINTNPKANTTTTAASEFFAVAVDVADAKNLTVKVSIAGTKTVTTTIAASDGDPDAAFAVYERDASGDATVIVTITVTDGVNEYVQTLNVAFA